jgi:hypothetical protein
VTIADGTVLGVTKIVDNGPAAERWNVVILSEGYQAVEMPRYHTDALAFVQYFQSVAPFHDLWGKINVYRVDVASTETGADDPAAGSTSATYFDSTYSYMGAAHRLLGGNDATALAVSRSQVPEGHITLVIVNAGALGGSGGQVAWFSTHSASAEIGMHELCHAYFMLEDEYTGGGPPAYVGPGEAPNITTDINRATTKWRDLISPSTPLPTMTNPVPGVDNLAPSPVPAGTVGLFEGAGRTYQGVYRAQYDCAMRTYGQPFCAVCQRQIRAMLAPFGGIMFWETNGNSAINPATEFLGTRDNKPLVVKTNGAERMRVAVNGNVGIGTDAPSAMLELKNGDLFFRAALEDAGDIVFKNSAGVEKGRVWSLPTAGSGLYFKSGDKRPAQGGKKPDLSINAMGDVGIGTDAPGAKLEINSGDVLLKDGDLILKGIPKSDPGAIFFQSSSGVQQGRIWTKPASKSALYLNCAGSDPQLSIDFGGNVGIGTSTPAAKLEISDGNLLLKAAVSNAGGIIFQSSVGAQKGRIWTEPTGAAGLYLSSADNNADISIDSSGKVGIGTRAPGAKLEVNNGDLLLKAAGNDAGDIVFQNSSGVQKARIWSEPTAATGLYLSGGAGNPDVSINSAGYVGIGTTQPQARLEVRASSPTDNALSTFASGTGIALQAMNTGRGPALVGSNTSTSSAVPAVVGHTFGNSAGVLGQVEQTGTGSFGVLGLIGPAPMPVAVAAGGIGVIGVSLTGTGAGGVTGGLGNVGNGVEGVHERTTGQGAGVHGSTLSPSGIGVFGRNLVGGDAGRFQGNVSVTGRITATGAKAFRIDHPLDPANKFLNHASIESPDMMNVYNGNVTTGGKSEAVVELPAYFEALNRDFRYQLTVIGEFAQVAVAREIKGNRFVIRTDRPNVKVSWQVTGIRRDPYAEAHRLQAEELKSKEERGRYLHPELYAPKSAKPEAKRPIGSLSGLLAQDDGRAPRLKREPKRKKAG